MELVEVTTEGMPFVCRECSVPHANLLWHVHSNPKITAWWFVLHGCIDGYSGKVIYLKLCANKIAATVQKLFEKGVEEFGLPS